MPGTIVGTHLIYIVHKCVHISVNICYAWARLDGPVLRAPYCCVRWAYIYIFFFWHVFFASDDDWGNRDVLHAGRYIFFFIIYRRRGRTNENGSKRMRECSRFRKRKSMLFGECGCLLHLKFVWTIIKMLFKSGG